jgi:hypothetical protein
VGTSGERVTLRYRAPRAAVSALLLATAIGAAGTTGVSTALGVDPPARVDIAGTLADGHGAALRGIDLIVSEELPPDGGLAGFQTTTGADGSFSVAVEPWGTANAPATLTIKAAPDTTLTVVGESCSQTWSVTLADTRQVALADAAAPPDPIALVAATALVGEVCGATGTPRPTPAPNSGSHSQANPTPPPTDANPTLGDREERPATALLVGFVVGLAAALSLLVRRPGARRRQ